MTAPTGRPPLTPRIRRDMVLDTVGNLSLAIGLWGWLEWRDGVTGGLATPALFIALCATGLLNLLHLPARLRRLREWRRQFPRD